MFDALIAGGGPAGSAAAIVLGRADRRVLLVDAAPARPMRLQVGESLPPAARPLLRDLGLLDGVERAAHLPSAGTVSAWGSSELEANDFVADPNGSGWHLDRRRFDRMLREMAAGAGVELREGVGARLVGGRGGAWRVRLGRGRGEEVGARVLIDATGRRAVAARSLGARRDRRDRLVALVAVVAAQEGDLDARTLVEAVAEGWWYTALVPGGRRVVAFLTDSDLVPGDARTAAGFRSLLSRTEHIARLVPAVSIQPQTEPAFGSLLDPPAGDGWLAIGDAALAFDPLSSQGILTALYTGLVGAEAVEGHLDGFSTTLDSYRQRIAAIATAYQRNLGRAYAAETRWPLRPFWARRMMILANG